MEDFIKVDISQFTVISVPSIIFWILIAALLIQLWYFLRFFSKLGRYKHRDLPDFSIPVSVIICAKNEEENLVEFLPLVLEQEYPKFEVVVVNDCSYDNSEDILKAFGEKYAHLKTVTIREDNNRNQGKKVAMMMGIKGSTHEYLVFTDADCKPKSKYWLKSMVQNFANDKTELILGYGAYEKTKGLLNRIIRYDTFTIALQYLSFSLAGKTYMGVGRNLAYKKSLFFKMKGFASHYHIPSGDDDLFVNEAATKHNTVIEISEESHTSSKAKKTYKEWMRQKRRHMTTYKKYKFRSKALLFFNTFSLYLFYLSFIVLLTLQFEPIVVVTLFFLRQLIQLLVYSKPLKILSERDLIFIFPIIEVILLILYPLNIIIGLVIKLINELDK